MAFRWAFLWLILFERIPLAYEMALLVGWAAKIHPAGCGLGTCGLLVGDAHL